MPFAAALRKSLEDRHNEVPAELLRGDSLEEVLNRHLMTVEHMGGDDVFTCILLLSPDGKRLSYGAAPTVPASYCRASESFEIGPCAGSCGAAAYFGHPVYSPDIEQDPVWGSLREHALSHGFRSCWSTPIRNAADEIIGTFAILHRTVGMPSNDEIRAIDLITDHVSDAIMRSRDSDFLARSQQVRPSAPFLRLVSDNDREVFPEGRLLALAKKLELTAGDLDSYASRSQSEAATEHLKDAAELSRKLAAKIAAKVDTINARKSGP